ncbi:endolytic transglycosylase MltG [Alteromonas pelagimontana]|uniref:Endolytic murein transglycosylase n=1 Tax=Alteromonas pelagimontana TaxID=1858656 RepID=A0A6M4MBB1_9ALTE|nr:endolytic transglycosylase MltG [Alteromonas pelagimontana]QJR79446.1 endolytic transglycosylase MltG [Alteromonas pelagimontana]
MIRVLKWLAVPIVLMIGVLGAVMWWQGEMQKPLALSEPTLLTIPQGASGQQVVRLIEQHNWLESNPFAVKLWLKFVFSPQSAKAGTYQIQPAMKLTDAFSLFANAEEFQFGVSLIEGLTLQQWLLILQQHEYITFDISDETLVALQDKWTMPPASGTPSLEGLLLADTYYFTAGTDASTILARAMAAMSRYLESAWAERATGLPLKAPYEALILASIIEKETAVPAERARIAGVFINRLNENMRLQTDPTVIYGVGVEFDGNLTRQHLRESTPYNTYVVKGLPPTPIAMAGKPAIQAALHPFPTDELYFVARGDGSHHFSSTLKEHNEAVNQYQIRSGNRNTNDG